MVIRCKHLPLLRGRPQGSEGGGWHQSISLTTLADLKCVLSTPLTLLPTVRQHERRRLLLRSQARCKEKRPTPLPNSTRPYAGEEWLLVRVLPKKRSRRLALSERQMAPNTKEVERLTFVCNQPAAVGPTLN